MMKKQYLIVAIGSFSLMFAFAFGIVGLSFFVKPVTEDLGLERAPFTFYFSLIFLIGMFTTPLIGKIINKRGPKPIVLVGSVICSLSFFLFSRSNTLVGFYAAAILMGFVFQGTTVLSATTSVNIWFDKKRGQILGLVVSASGFGGALLSFILPRLISTYGWRNGYVFLSICWLVLTLPVGLFLIRNRPETYNLLPYGAKIRDDTSNTTDASNGMSLSQAKRSPLFYLLIVSFFLTAVVLSGNQHLPSHFSEIGLSDVRLGSLMSAYSIFVIAFKIIFGTLSDKIGIRNSFAIISAAGVLSYILISTTGSYFLLFICIFLMAAFNPAISIIPSMTTYKIFGGLQFPAIWALVGMAASFGQFIGAPLFGLVFDLTGSYIPAFVAVPVLVLISYSLVAFCVRKPITN